MTKRELYNWIRETTGLDCGELPEIPQELEPVFQVMREELDSERCRRMDSEATLAFFKASANAMPNPIFIKDGDLRFVYFNRAYRDFFGMTDDTYIGKRVQELTYLSPEDRERYHAEDSEMVSNLSVIQYETVFQTAEQGAVEALYWSKGFCAPETRQRGLIGEIVDISHEKKTQNELRRSMRALELLMQNAKDASNTDPLTKLYNRNVMEEDGFFVIQEAEAMGQPVCGMLMDIDHFEQINDTYGHPFGDEILQRFAQLLRQAFRRQDIAVRYGGDEFFMLLPGTGLEQAADGAERLRKALHALERPDGGCVTVSVGITQWKPGDELQAFITRADEALYLVKKAGRNGVAVKR